MKKLLSTLLAAVLCFSLVACGGNSGPDKQPAIDAYNELAANYNKFVETANEDLSDWSDEDVEYMNSVAEAITQYGTQLGDDTEFTQEQLDEMIKACNDFNEVIEGYLAEEG